MVNEEFEAEEYKLRAGPPMPTQQSGSFVTHTFGVDKYRIIIKPVTDTIADSSEFRGQGGPYISASYSRLQDKSGLKFSGRLVYSPTFEDESVLDG